MTEIRNCPTCLNDFTVKFKCRKKRFCSKRCARTGENNPAWKGDNVGMQQVHTWVEKRLGRPDKCSKCSRVGNVDLANISQEYKRDLDDWEWLCRKCHMESDGRLDIFLSHSQKKKLPEKDCLQCGVSFEPYSQRSKFCSMSCRTTYTNLTQMDYKNRKSAWETRKKKNTTYIN